MQEADAGTGGGEDAGTAAGDAGADSAVTLQAPALCSPEAIFSAAGRIDSVAPTNLARFGGVSGDELTLAFSSATGDAFVADRPSNTAAFGDPAMVNDPSVRLAADRVALGPAGTSLLALAAGRLSFVGFERADRGQPWAATSGLEFTALRVRAEGGANLYSPVLGADKRSLFFIMTVYDTPMLYESRWDTAQRMWGMASNVGNPELKSTDLAHLRRPTGASADGHTLFFYDEVAGIERGAWRDAPGSPFVFFADIGRFAEAAPSAACDALYHQGTDDTGIRLFQAQ